MKEILIYLISIQRTAKGLHYFANGKNFYSDHLLADRIYDGLDDFIDDIQENYFVGQDMGIPQQNELLLLASKKIPAISGDDISAGFEQLMDLIIKCIAEIEKVLSGKEIVAGDSDLLGRISSDLLKKNGFIQRRIMGE